MKKRKIIKIKKKTHIEAAQENSKGGENSKRTQKSKEYTCSQI